MSNEPWDWQYTKMISKAGCRARVERELRTHSTPDWA